MKNINSNFKKMLKLFEFDYNELMEINKIYKDICKKRKTLGNKWGINVISIIEQSLYINIIISLYKFIEEGKKVVQFKKLCNNYPYEYTQLTDSLKKVKDIRNNIIAHNNSKLHMTTNSNTLYKVNNIEEAIKYIKESFKNPTDEVDSEKYTLSIKEIDESLNLIHNILSKIKKNEK